MNKRRNNSLKAAILESFIEFDNCTKKELFMEISLMFFKRIEIYCTNLRKAC